MLFFHFYAMKKIKNNVSLTRLQFVFKDKNWKRFQVSILFSTENQKLIEQTQKLKIDFNFQFLFSTKKLKIDRAELD